MLLSEQQIKNMYFSQQMKDDPHHSQPENAVKELAWSNHYEGISKKDVEIMKQDEAKLLSRYEAGNQLLKDYKLVVKYRNTVHTMSNGQIQGYNDDNLLGIARIEQGHVATSVAYVSAMAFPKKWSLSKLLKRS